MKTDQRVLIAGGGPVGLFCALLLGRAGVPVTVFDMNDELLADPRAATTHPATLEVLGAAGLVEDMAAVGLTAPTFQFWDRVAGKLVATFDLDLLKNDTKYPFVIQCEQFKTAHIILKRVLELSNVDVLFGHKVISFEDTGSGIVAQVETKTGVETHKGSWIIGADGGRSTVRKQADIAFEGFTWAERFLVITTPFDFNAELGYCHRSYFADPDEWCNCFKVAADGPPGLWRLVFPADAEAAEADLLSDESVHARMQKFFPNETPYDIVHRNIYTVHQRVAATFRKSRVLLAGDSAHVNNSIGGMGLNGGLQDAANLAEKLAQVIGGADESLMDLYSLQRRNVSIEFVQAQSIANKKQLETREPEERRKVLEDLAATAADPVRARQYLLRSSMLALQARAAAITLAEAAA